MQLQVVYEDNHVIAVAKLPGVLSQGDATGDMSIYDMVKDYIRIKKGKISGLGNAHPVRNSEGSQRKVSNGVFVGLLHRLDRPVSGIMLFAKTSKGASRLSEQFRNHEVEKIYHAIVLGKPRENRGMLVNFLIKDEKLKKGVEREGGNESKLYYEIIKSNEKYSLLKIKIDTGKFHQIRSQLSFAGFPILGDVKYKGEKWKYEKAIALCATNLNFQTATGEKIVELSIELPEEWKKFI